MTKILRFENFTYKISTIKPQDNERVVEIMQSCFGFIDSKEEMIIKLSKRLNNINKNRIK